MGDDPPARRVGLFGMVVMGFFWVCGGMYGNEELLGTAPPALVLLALIVVPCCHSLPVSMMIAECGTAWPADGGLPVFVQHAFGDTIGGHNTFFTWLNCLVDAAIYPVMAASYTRELLGHYQVVVDERLTCVVIVTLMTAMQLRGLDWMVCSSQLLLLTPSHCGACRSSARKQSVTALTSCDQRDKWRPMPTRHLPCRIDKTERRSGRLMRPRTDAARSRAAASVCAFLSVDCRVGEPS